MKYLVMYYVLNGRTSNIFAYTNKTNQFKEKYNALSYLKIKKQVQIHIEPAPFYQNENYVTEKGSSLGNLTFCLINF